MTLIIAAVGKNYITHVSDRRITKFPTGIHDYASNKSIIFSAQESLVTVSYTGVAYMNNIPTDEQLVRWMMQEKWTDSSATGMSFGPPDKHEINLDCVVGRIFRKLKQYFASAPEHIARHSFELCVVGWRGWHDLWWPIFIMFTKPENQKELISFKIPPHEFHSRSHVYFSGGWSRQYPAEHDSIKSDADFAQGLVNDFSPFYLQSKMVECIRAVARVSSAVGPDVMCIVLDAMRHQAFVEFRGVSREGIYTEFDPFGNQIEFAWTPWIVGASRPIMAPSALHGPNPISIRAGYHDIHLRSSQPSGPVRLQITTPPRKPFV